MPEPEPKTVGAAQRARSCGTCRGERFLSSIVNGLAVERALPMDAAAAAAEATTLSIAVSAVVRINE